MSHFKMQQDAWFKNGCQDSIEDYDELDLIEDEDVIEEPEVEDQNKATKKEGE